MEEGEKERNLGNVCACEKMGNVKKCERRREGKEVLGRWERWRRGEVVYGGGGVGKVKRVKGGVEVLYS